jgi:outer membrane protein assembly factor BamB
VTETQYGWGTASSPIVYEDRLYVVNDNDEKSYLLVLDKKTGEEIFRVEREEKTNYATPYIWKNALRTELITSGVGYTRSYDLEGKLLWQIKGKSILAIPTPFEKYGNLYLAAGHIVWGKNPVYVVKPGASGDITLDENETKSEFIVWSSDKLGPYHPTPLIVDDVYYFLYDRGFMAAVDPKTGEEIGKRKRIPNGRAFTSSPWSYGGKLFFLNEDGVTFVVDAKPEMEILHTNKLADDDMCMATPVIVGDKLLIRTAKRLYCVGQKNATAAR